MSEAWAYAGAALLFLATLPQAARLLRTRRADDLAWTFVVLNAVGIALLAWRSWEIGETAFLALNLSTVAFWARVAMVKLAGPNRAAQKRVDKERKGTDTGAT